MEILSRINVSKIKHMVLEVPDLRRNTFLSSSDGIGNGMVRMASVLGSRRFSGLQTLRIGIASTAELHEWQIVHLAVALIAGQFTELRTLSLPRTYVEVILSALMEGQISQRLHILSWRTIQHRLSLCGEFWTGFWKAGASEACNILNYLEDILAIPVFSWALGEPTNLTSLNMSKSGINLAALVPFLSSKKLKTLIADSCAIDSRQIERFTDTILNVACSSLALRRLDLHNNSVDEGAVPALLRLAQSNKLDQLQELDLSMNSGLNSTALVTLMETIQRGHLPSLKLLIWDRAGTRMQIQQRPLCDSKLEMMGCQMSGIKCFTVPQR
ncbi:unnamed protein product [Calypogeia fissa]